MLKRSLIPVALIGVLALLASPVAFAKGTPDRGTPAKEAEMTIEELEKHAVVLDHLFLDFPLDIRSTYLWKTLKLRGLLCCGCCCCDSHHAAHGASPAAAPLPTPAPPPPTTRVTLVGTAFALTLPGVPGGTSARVEFQWDATGGTNVRVDIEVQTIRVYNGYGWTPVANLRNQPPTGRGIWWGNSGYSAPAIIPGYRYQARAVAKEPGKAPVYSNVVTF